mgnify:FL=1
MNKHPDCEDRCQILEHKGYHDCSRTGRCELLEAMTDKTSAPEQELIATDAFGLRRYCIMKAQQEQTDEWSIVARLVRQLLDAQTTLERRLRAAPSAHEQKD